jgi:hypothetical protein
MKFGLFYELSVERPWTRESERTVYKNAPLPRGILPLPGARVDGVIGPATENGFAPTGATMV